MKNEEILKKAIEKAVANDRTFAMRLGDYEVDSRYGWLDGEKKGEPYVKQFQNRKMFYREISSRDILFYIPFAKAFWGIKRGFSGTLEIFPNSPQTYDIEAWQYHLQQMVLEEDPIKYLEKFL